MVDFKFYKASGRATCRMCHTNIHEKYPEVYDDVLKKIKVTT